MTKENDNGMGWISLHRSIKNHWLYEPKRPRTKLEAWEDILMTVNHAPRRVMIDSKVIECNRGESLQSMETWAQNWKWSKSAVRRFFKLLEQDEMIILLKSTRKTTHLKVCNYESYQLGRISNESQVNLTRISSESQVKLNNNVNKDNNENNEGISAPSPDSLKAIWEPTKPNDPISFSDFCAMARDCGPWSHELSQSLLELVWQRFRGAQPHKQREALVLTRKRHDCDLTAPSNPGRYYTKALEEVTKPKVRG